MNKELKSIVDNYDCDTSSNLIKKIDLNKYQNLLKVSFGSILQEYLLNYGYIGYNDIEFYGINSKQLDSSDMVTQTIYLHNNFAKTNGYIAIEHSSEHVYTIVDSKDMVFYYDTTTDSITETNMNLTSYILHVLSNSK